ncbi:MAG: hypothetical protein H7Z41_04180 [Cytophagales bacterium]|nr:hypothetical protein [Armatimonadota bacterium]
MTPPNPPTLYLIDGYAAIFRAFFAIRRPLYSPVTGEPTQAILVFAQMLLKLYATHAPDYVVVAWDAPGRTFRDDLYARYALAGPGDTVTSEPAPPWADPPSEADTTLPDTPTPTAPQYKGTRRATPDSLGQQVPRILEILGQFGIPVIGKPGLEADDVIATITDRVLRDPTHPDIRVRIVSRDKDLEQLLGERVTLFDVHTDEETDEAALWTRRGVTPAQVVDFLTLTGDAVDNIPGVAGIGSRTAAKLLQQYGSLEGVLENLPQIKGFWRENLEQARPTLPISQRLIALERDPEILFDLETARARPVPASELASLFETLGFARMREQMLRF